ncbi:MAG: ParB/RepB/Spo0J family partition protein [Proteobacteria bacterium]|nr:ParB/RepB/Spo0J family partition protein [Pseudomonadota bacterium]
MTKKKVLGRGLGALIDDTDSNLSPSGAPLEVPIEAVSPNPLQPRREIKPVELKALTGSIRDKGVLEPLLVRRVEPGRYELIAGERRLRAAGAAGLKTVPVVVREAGRDEMLELALIENLLREDLNPVEEAEAYRRLADEFGKTQEDLARLTGKDRSTVANLLRLLHLPGPVLEDVRQGRLSAGHARALLALGDPGRIAAAREQVLAGHLSVRQTEALVKRALRGPKKKTDESQDRTYYQALAEQMTRSLGCRARVLARGKKGRVEIAYNSIEELERLLGRLGVDPVV